MIPFIFNAPTHPNDQHRQAIISQITGQGAPQPMSGGQGAMQGFNSVLNGLALRAHDRGPFPDAPGGASPNFMTGLANFFGRGGGLY